VEYGQELVRIEPPEQAPTSEAAAGVAAAGPEAVAVAGKA